MVFSIKGHSGRVAADECARKFKAFLRAVVARLAEALQIRGVKEQRPVASVGRDVIGNRCRCPVFKLKTERAKRRRLKLIQSKAFPFRSAVKAQAFFLFE